MNYSSGDPVKIGDPVWWDEYQATGNVVKIFKSPEEIRSVGLDEPSIWICYDGSNSDSGLFVAYPERAIRDDEVRLISSAENAAIAKALFLASDAFEKDVSNATLGVFVRKDEDGEFAWEIKAFRNGYTLEKVTIKKSLCV